MQRGSQVKLRSVKAVQTVHQQVSIKSQVPVLGLETVVCLPLCRLELSPKGVMKLWKSTHSWTQAAPRHSVLKL